MQQLQQFIENQQLRNDPNWSLLFDSDIKSIFPKYQLIKIQRSKIKLDRYRLMMDNLEDLLLLQKHKKQSQKINTKHLLCELEQLQAQQYHSYELDIIQKKDRVEQLIKQLVKFGKQKTQNKIKSNPYLENYLSSNADKPWSLYFDKNCPNNFECNKEKQDLGKNQKIFLSRSVQLGSEAEKKLAINEGLPAQILSTRHKHNYLLKKLKQKIFKGHQKVEVESMYARDWMNALKKLNLQ